MVTGEDRSTAPSQPGSTAKDEATLVCEAVARHPQAVIVEPADPADRDLAQAVQEARSKAFRGNKTKNETAFRMAHWKETSGSTARRPALSQRSELALNS
jgi:hypothetical protein